HPAVAPPRFATARCTERPRGPPARTGSNRQWPRLAAQISRHPHASEGIALGDSAPNCAQMQGEWRNQQARTRASHARGSWFEPSRAHRRSSRRGGSSRRPRLASPHPPLSGKVLEVPVERILSGADPEKAASRDSLANPEARDPFVE